MDEYISRNELLKAVQSNVAEAHNERCGQLLEAILNAPTADVVPKSEVDKWFRECEELQGRLIEFKKEIAREIFEDIKKFDCRPIPESKAVYIIGESKFAELKKKYMESEDTK